MTDTPRYQDGFLAAVRPGHHRVPEREPQPDTRSEPAAPILPTATVGTTENFSVEERIKRRLHPLDSFTRLLDCAGTNCVPDPDDQFRFRWFGLFYQAPAQDAFLLRLRLPGGRLRAFQLAGLAGITQAHASGQIVLNAQGGLDIPGIPVRAAVEILRAVEGIGLSARQTGGDGVQAVRGGEDDGLIADHPRTPFGPLVGALEQVLMHERALADLPRGCEIIFQRADEPLTVEPRSEIDTILLRETSALPTSPGFLLAVHGDMEGGFLLPNSRALSGCVKLLHAWAAGADRTDRTRAGLASFCGALGRERVGALLDDAPWQPWPIQPRTRTDEQGSRLPPGFAVPGGRLLSGQLSLIEEIIRKHGCGEIRLHRGRMRIRPPVANDAEVALHLALAGE